MRTNTTDQHYETAILFTCISTSYWIDYYLGESPTKQNLPTTLNKNTKKDNSPHYQSTTSNSLKTNFQKTSNPQLNKPLPPANDARTTPTHHPNPKPKQTTNRTRPLLQQNTSTTIKQDKLNKTNTTSQTQKYYNKYE